MRSSRRAFSLLLHLCMLPDADADGGGLLVPCSRMAYSRRHLLARPPPTTRALPA